MKLHIDIETYSSIPIKTSGLYKYVESPDFEILLIAYALDNNPVKIIDLTQPGVNIHSFIELLEDPKIQKHAHNANFERIAFKQYGFDIPIDQWYCSMVKAAYCGFPLSLDQVSKAMKLEEKGKLTTGKALIKYFCTPCTPTKANGMRSRNFPKHDPEKWEDFKRYCINDVIAERQIDINLEAYPIPYFERRNYILDQEINDRGILIDSNMAKQAFEINEKFSKEVIQNVKDLTGIENPNSPAQLKEWIGEAIGEEIESLAKESLPDILDKAESDDVREVIDARKKLSKSSVKKYIAMLNCICDDGRAHGLFQFYGANRTGRWAGRLIQLQNLPQNHMKDLDEARKIISSGDYDLVTMLYDNVPNILSELIRTAFIAKPGYVFSVADFSAIEARVIAWLAEEQWRLEVFNTHGKIYEASASKMFNVPIEKVTKGSDLRQKGKTAELALGYQGSVGAMKKMDRDGKLTDQEMKSIVYKWRNSNKAIVKFWNDVEQRTILSVKKKKQYTLRNLIFDYDGKAFTIQLPSGRKLFYQSPKLELNQFGKMSMTYMGMDQKGWTKLQTYGGKLVENIVQAVSRDLLAYSMLRLNQEGYKIVMHVHDEAACEIPEDDAKDDLKIMCSIMGEKVPWAEGLPLNADGYITKFYKKD